LLACLATGPFAAAAEDLRPGDAPPGSGAGSRSSALTYSIMGRLCHDPAPASCGYLFDTPTVWLQPGDRSMLTGYHGNFEFIGVVDGTYTISVQPQCQANGCYGSVQVKVDGGPVNDVLIYPDPSIPTPTETPTLTPTSTLTPSQTPTATSTLTPTLTPTPTSTPTSTATPGPIFISGGVDVSPFEPSGQPSHTRALLAVAALASVPLTAAGAVLFRSLSARRRF